jgi:predicted acylesterase/phospholipase RssA
MNYTAEHPADNKIDASNETPLFLVLAGGGAKGIAHIAVWEELERLVSTQAHQVTDLPAEFGSKRFRLTEIAGTSAGALVAAFIAAGAKSTDLIDSSGRMPLCEVLGIKHFREIFGIRGWRRIKLMQGVTNPTQTLRQRIQGELRRAAPSPPFGDPVALGSSNNIRRSKWKNLLNLMLLGLVVFVMRSYGAASWIIENPFILVALLMIVQTLFFISNTAVRILERSKIVKKRRVFSVAEKIIFHPILTISLAGTITIFLVVPLTKIYPNIFEVLRQTWAYVLCWIIVDVLIVVALSRFVIGAINTLAIAKDLDTALRAVLTLTPEYDIASHRYLWKNRSPNSAGHEEVRCRLLADPTRQVTFLDLRDATGISLSVVAADIISRSAIVYGTGTHPHFPVAIAVAASLAIPFAFRPIGAGPQILFDGGLVSNFPVWVQRRRLSLNPDARLLAVGFDDSQHESWLPEFFALREAIGRSSNGKRWIGRLLVLYHMPTASVFWPIELLSNALRAMSSPTSFDTEEHHRLDSISLDPQIKLLDFDLSAEQVSQEMEMMKAEARVWIERVLWMRNASFHAIGAVVERAIRANSEGTIVDGRIRISWAEREGATPAVRIRFTYNFSASDTDDRLVFPFGSCVTALAAESGQALFARRPIIAQLRADFTSRYLASVTWRDISWSWAIPVLVNHRVAGVLTIESNLDLSQFNSDLASAERLRSHAWIDPVTQEIRRSTSGAPIVPPSLPEDDAMSKLEIYFAALVLAEFSPTLERERSEASRKRSVE